MPPKGKGKGKRTPNAPPPSYESAQHAPGRKQQQLLLKFSAFGEQLAISLGEGEDSTDFVAV